MSGAKTVAGLRFEEGEVVISDNAHTLGATQAESSVASGALGTLQHALTGSGKLVKTGGGPLTVQPASTHTGGIAFNGGTLATFRGTFAPAELRRATGPRVTASVPNPHAP